MKRLFYFPFVISLFLSCHDKDISFCDTCENFQEGYVIGYDPCSGVLDQNNEELGFIISIPSKRDTVVTYNFEEGLYDIPKDYFSYYRSYCMFPDSAWNDFPIKLKYRDVTESERKHIYCSGDIYTYYFQKYVKDRQIVVLSLTK